jgi:hypothetical protein
LVGSRESDCLRQLVRGEADVDEALEAFGVSAPEGGGSQSLRVPAGLPEVELPLSDPRAFDLWVSTILMLDVVRFVEAESPEEDRLIEALWRASTGESVDEPSLALARSLAR